MVLSRASLIVLTSLAIGAAHADISFDTFGPGNAFNLNTGYTISTSSSVIATEYNLAQQFLSATTGGVTSITVGAVKAKGSGNVTLALYEDNGSNGIGSTLGTWTVNLQSSDGIQSVLVSPGISLVANHQYWLGMSGQDDTWAAWCHNTTGATGHLLSNTDGDFIGIYSAIRVETQAVPEPASWAALGLGVAAMIRRRKRAA